MSTGGNNSSCVSSEVEEQTGASAGGQSNPDADPEESETEGNPTLDLLVEKDANVNFPPLPRNKGSLQFFDERYI